MKPRVFVSSVIEGFEEYREAARRGIVAAGGEPVLIEDYSSLPASPRNACLDGVDSSDIHITIIGRRGGCIAPSGKLVVEEEYEEALRRKLHIFAFVQTIERDKQADHLVNKLSDYVKGVFLQTFNTPAELGKAIEKALTPVIKHESNPKVNFVMLNEKLQEPYKILDETSLRLVIIPERSDEFIGPVELESEELRDQLLQIGHSSDVRLFSYERPKETEIEVNSIIILQSHENRRQQLVDVVRVELTTEGLIIIDTNVTNCTARDRLQEMLSSMAIIEDEIISKLNNVSST